jgi:hypothetical protein
MLALKNVVPAMVVRSLVAPSAAARSLAKEHFDAKKAHGKLSVLPLIAHERPIGERWDHFESAVANTTFGNSDPSYGCALLFVPLRAD